MNNEKLLREKWLSCHVEIRLLTCQQRALEDQITHIYREALQKKEEEDPYSGGYPISPFSQKLGIVIEKISRASGDLRKLEQEIQQQTG